MLKSFKLIKDHYIILKEIVYTLMENKHCSSTNDRKTIERNRRNKMKALYSNLYSLLPQQTSRESVSLPDQLEEAAKYIKKLQIRLEKMKERKDSLMRIERPNTNVSCWSGTRSPKIEVNEMGSALEVVLITGLDSQLVFNETIRVLHEEEAEIVNASFSVVDDTVFHTIHSKVGDSAPGYGAARISERLKKFVQDSIQSF